MIPTVFKIAMFNHAGVAPFHVFDSHADAPGRDWLIVERLGKWITISDGIIPSEPQDVRAGAEAPFDLRENVSICANHIYSSSDGTEMTFLLCNVTPLGAASDGDFAPTCGIVKLGMSDSGIVMSAQGRETHDSGFDMEAGLASYGEVKASVARRWSFSAQYRPWQGEQLPRRKIRRATLL